MKLNRMALQVCVVIAGVLFSSAAMAKGRVFFRNDFYDAIFIKFDDYPSEPVKMLQPGGIFNPAASSSHISPGANTIVTIMSSYSIILESGGGGCWSKGDSVVTSPDGKHITNLFQLKIHDKFTMVAHGTVAYAVVYLSCIKSHS